MRLPRPSTRPGAGRRQPWSLGRIWRLVESRRADLNPLDGSDRPDDAFEVSWRRIVQSRGFVVLLLFAVWGVSLQGRLIYLQVVQHDRYRAIAADQQQDLEPIASMRGDIRDRHGRLLAYSVDAQSLVVRPRLVKDPKATVAALCAAMTDCTAAERADWLKKMTSQRRFDYLRRARAVSPAKLTRVMALHLPGIATEADTRRYYPAGDLASHVLGYVSVDNRGQGGIEHAYDAQLRGQAGRMLVQADALGERVSTQVQQAPVPGASLELTIDLNYQHIVERELRAGVEANRAAGGTAVLMDPTTGEILAMASYPSFNSNNAWEATDDERRNRSIQDVYEPGSTFKIITASAALEEGVVKPTDIIDTNPGYIRLSGRSRPISDVHSAGAISFEDVIVKSSNVGAVKVALRTGADRFAKYVRRFGFGEANAPDLIGESRGLWRDTNISDSSLASAAMGYEISVTPLQMATAVSAVANGGLLMEPRLVRAVGADVVRPKVLRRAVEAQTAATLTAIMEGVVERGTATAAQIEGFRIAGKTGTANKVAEHGGYSPTDFNASFVGFFPSRAPQFALIVVIDTPRAGTHFGGTVAAPVFHKIAEATLQRAGVGPSVSPAPPVLLHAGASTLPPAAPVSAIVPTVLPVGGFTPMPDLGGLSLREATRALLAAGLTATVQGEGFVVRQWPEPGHRFEPGTTATVRLERTGRDEVRP